MIGHCRPPACVRLTPLPRFSRIARLLVHVFGFALVCALAAYWIVRIVTPPPTAAPAPVAGPAPRDADPTLAARLFGLVQQAAQPVVSNVQVAGVFAAGRDSSAVLIVDNKQARAYVLGQEVAPGSKLVAVRADGVTLERSGSRQELGLAAQPAVAALGTAAPAPAFAVQNGMLTAPSLDSAPARSPPPLVPVSPTPNVPTIRPQPPVPGMPATVNAPPPQGQPAPPGIIQ